jgi:hypothetical protein
MYYKLVTNRWQTTYCTYRQVSGGAGADLFHHRGGRYFILRGTFFPTIQAYGVSGAKVSQNSSGVSLAKVRSDFHAESYNENQLILDTETFVG